MTNTAKALYGFFSSFGLPAYVIGSVPDETPDGQPVEPPYITYQLREPNWRTPGQLYAELWYRSTSIVPINAKTDEIRAAIGEGLSLPTDGGAVYLYDFNAEPMYMEGDDTLKRMYMTMTIEATTT